MIVMKRNKFLHPHGAVDSAENVFVCERDLDDTQKFFNNGTLIHSLEESGMEPANLKCHGM
jgi:hypothetical protein